MLAKATTHEEFVRVSALSLRFAMNVTRNVAHTTRLALFVKAETNAELLREINDASFEANKKLAAVIENAQEQDWVRDDWSLLTFSVWIRGQILGRYVLEIDGTRYDGGMDQVRYRFDRSSRARKHKRLGRVFVQKGTLSDIDCVDVQYS